MFWILFSISTLFLALIADPENTKIRRVWKIPAKFLIVLILSYISAFGSIVGTDNINYGTIYETYVDFIDLALSFGLQSEYKIESGYAFMNILGHKLGLGFPGFLFLYQIIVNTLFVSVIFRFRRPAIGLFLFIISTVYFQEVNLVRQMLAISLFLFSLDFLEKKKIVYYLILICVGSLIHTSILFLLILIIVPYIDVQKFSNTIKLTIGVIWIYSLVSIFVPDFFAVPSFIANLLSDTSYSRFVDGSDDAGANVDSNYIHNFMVLLYFLLHREKICLYDIIFLLGCIMINLSMSLPPLYRLALYFTAIYPIYLYTLVYNMTLKNNQIRYAITMFLFAFYVLYVFIGHMIMMNSNLLGTDFYPFTQFYS